MNDSGVGGRNLRFLGLEIHAPVFVGSSLLILTLVIFTILYPTAAAGAFDAALKLITSRAGWLMGSLANLFVIFCFLLIISPYGAVRIGGANAKPEFSRSAWFAMLFTAGMGIGLIFYSVAEPISHYTSSVAATAADRGSYAPLTGAPGDPVASMRLAMAATIFHWTLHPWAIFAVVALSLALFKFNFNLPLTIRSGFYPLFGDRVWGSLGNLIDALAIIATVAGLATSLGLGAQQALAGVNYLFGVAINATNQIILVGVIAAITTVSLVLGLEKGVRRLSEINLALAAALCLFVIAFGPTAKILAALPENLTAYVAELPALANSFGRRDAPFFHDWTIFYWAWWAAWAPFVGMFIARISNGRTVRELIFFVMLLPSLVSVVWFTAFGTVAIDQIVAEGNMIAAEADLPVKLFAMLKGLPFAEISSTIGIILVVVFFVTSWDSGSLVLDTLGAGGKIDTPKVQRVFWVAVVGAAAIALLLGGGLRSLQSGSVVTGMPFMIIIALMCAGIVKGLHRALKLQREAL